MLSLNETQITRDELVRRVRTEVQRRRALTDATRAREQPRGEDRTAMSWRTFNESIATADYTANVGTKLPAMNTFSGLRRRLAVPVAKLIVRAARLVTSEQVTFNQAVLGALRNLADAVRGHTSTFDERLTIVRDELTAEVGAEVGAAFAEAEARAAERERTLTQRLDALPIDAIRQDVGAVRTELATQIADLARDVLAERRRIENLRIQVLLQERRLSLLLEEARRAPGSVPNAVASEVVDHLQDAFYVGFEDYFRGSRDEIKRRAEVYLPLVRESGAGTAERPVLDLGCGRGEWLELLKEHGLEARGIDGNEAMVTEGTERGLDVVHSDVLAYLRRVPDASLGAVSAIHLLEHLPFPLVIKLLDEVVRVLGPGGVAIFETPNPENILVGSCQFYVDPTHRNPLHPDTMAFLAEARGLSRVEIRRLHPAEERLRFADNGSDMVQRLNEYFFGPQDFAVVGYRA